MLNYNFLIDQEMIPSEGCRCGSCSDPTGKWIVSNKEDSIELKFDSEEEAIKWVNKQ